MSKKVKVSKVEVQIAGKTLSLSVEQARELRDILCDTFPTDTKEVIYREYYPYRRWRTVYLDASTTDATCNTTSNVSTDTLYLTAQ